MRLRIRYLASVREQFQCEGETLEGEDTPATLGALRQQLAASTRPELAQPNIGCAINGIVCRHGVELALADGDEIAFFPPMTGG